MNISNQFAALPLVYLGYEHVIMNDHSEYVFLFTGKSHPDDENTQFHYSFMKMGESSNKVKEITTDFDGNVVEVSSGKLTPAEARALHVEGIYVPDFWVNETTVQS